MVLYMRAPRATARTTPNAPGAGRVVSQGHSLPGGFGYVVNNVNSTIAGGPCFGA